jgi:hypothetical protein
MDSHGTTPSVPDEQLAQMAHEIAALRLENAALRAHAEDAEHLQPRSPVASLSRSPVASLSRSPVASLSRSPVASSVYPPGVIYVAPPAQVVTVVPIATPVLYAIPVVTGDTTNATAQRFSAPSDGLHVRIAAPLSSSHHPLAGAVSSPRLHDPSPVATTSVGHAHHSSLVVPSYHPDATHGAPGLAWDPYHMSTGGVVHPQSHAGHALPPQRGIPGLDFPLRPPQQLQCSPRDAAHAHDSHGGSVQPVHMHAPLHAALSQGEQVSTPPTPGSGHSLGDSILKTLIPESSEDDT